MFLERKKTNKLAYVISMIHQRGRKTISYCRKWSLLNGNILNEMK